jgi:hypothetical protein
MKSRIGFGLAYLLAAWVTCQAAWIPVAESEPNATPRVSVVRAADGWAMSIEVPGLEAEQSVTGPIAVDQLYFSGALPEDGLPAVSQVFALSSDGNPQVEVVSEEWADLPGQFTLAASELSGFGDDAYFPAESCKISPRSVMGGLPLAVVEMNAVKYNPALHQAKALRRAEIRIHETGTWQGLNRPITESMAEVLRPVVSNWSAMGLDDQVVRGTYLFILAKDTLAQNGIHELIKWKQRKGHSIETAGPTQIGSWTAANIKAYIQARYNAANPPLEYVCLVGDANGTYLIPAYTYSLEGSSGVGDVDYTYLQGNDLLPDVNIGRFTFASPSDLRIMVNRTLRYERTPSASAGGTKPNWYLGGGAFAGSASSGISTVHTMRTVFSRMVDAGYPSTSIDTVFYSNQSVGATEINTSINSGTSLWCYRGYIGMSGYSTSDVQALTNVGRWPYMLNLTCSTNDYGSSSYDQCEAFFAAGTPTNPTGPVAICGMSSSHTNTRYNNALMCGAVQGLLVEGVHTTGGAINRGKLQIYRSYPEDSAAGRLQFFMGITNLLGDPSVDVFTDTPDTLQVNNPASIPIGTNSMSLTVTDSYNHPVSDAYVNLVKGTEIFKGGWTNSSGTIVLNFATTTAETLFVTASKHNCRPAINYTLVTTPTVNVAPTTQSFAAVVPSQSVQMSISLKNWGSTAANGVQAVLSGTDPYITGITHATVSYGTIAGGTSVAPADHFDFGVASYAPDGYVVQFTLTVTDNAANSWVSAVPVPISNGHFTYRSMTVNNAGDGILDPAETGQLAITLQNSGTRAIPAGTVGYLRCLNPVVTVTDSVGSYPATAVGGTVSNSGNTFGVAAATAAIPGERVPFQIVFPLASGYADTVLFHLTIGTVTSSSPTPCDQYGYWAFDDTDINFDKHPTYNWVEIDPREPYLGPGTVIPIADATDEDDMTAIVNLPFSFTYYGESFNQISVCSNGWIAMGADQVLHADFRNYYIPSAVGPRRMIAPFWDDLREVPGSTGGTVFQGADACPATVIPQVPFYGTGTTTGYANNYTGTCVGNGAADVIYQLTPTVTGSYTVSLCGSNFDTGLIIKTGGACPGTTQVDCNDDNTAACGTTASQITATLTAGTVYYIIVDGWSASSGNYNLSVTLGAAPPADPAGVYYYHDAANHRFIVEWSRVTKAGSGENPEETFQVILKEPGYPATPTGDGEILFQYLTCNNVPDVSTSNAYATVGIENPDKTDGVLYSYWNQVSPEIPGAAAMVNNRAILFTTQKMLPTTPQAPGKLTAFSSPTSVVLSWNAVRLDINNSPITVTGYKVYGSNVPSFVCDGSTLLATTSDTTLTRIVADDGARFFYVVKAYTGAAAQQTEGPASDESVPAINRD